MPNYNTDEDNRMFDNLDAAIRRHQELLDEQTVWCERLPTEAERHQIEDDEQYATLQVRQQVGDGNCLFTVLFFVAVAVNLWAQIAT